MSCVVAKLIRDPSMVSAQSVVAVPFAPKVGIHWSPVGPSQFFESLGRFIGCFASLGREHKGPSGLGEGFVSHGREGASWCAIWRAQDVDCAIFLLCVRLRAITDFFHPTNRSIWRLAIGRTLVAVGILNGSDYSIHGWAQHGPNLVEDSEGKNGMKGGGV